MGSLQNDSLRNEIQTYTQKRIACVANLVDRGYYLQADAELSGLEKSVRYRQWKDLLALQRRRLNAKPLQEALKIERSFEKIRVLVQENKFAPKLEDQLSQIATRTDDSALKARMLDYQRFLSRLIKLKEKSS